ncbi:unannotated protein [freshwater metagenome]|uniref:Unannotated protein n=1 Tax=freshwater metagenome TaxID=449393 RepID=A0A6J7VYH8_9ZZZZ
MLGPVTVPLAVVPANVVVETAYENVLFTALIAVTVNVPSNGEPTPLTITESPILKP